MDDYACKLAESKKHAETMEDFQIGTIISWYDMTTGKRVLASRVVSDLGAQFVVDVYPEGITPTSLWKPHVTKTRYGYTIPINEPNGRLYRFTEIRRIDRRTSRSTTVALFLR